MTNDNWRPLSRRGGESDPLYDSLHEGVPDWLRQPLLDWIKSALRYGVSSGAGWQTVFLDTVVTRLRRPLSASSSETREAINSLVELATNDDEYHLDVVDLILEFQWGSVDKGRLGRLLVDSGSAWTLSSKGRLERRLTEAATALLRDAAAGDARPNEYLREARAQAFGRTPNRSGAYRDAVRAVEAALRPIVSPNDDLATLGKMLGEIRAKPKGFAVRLEGSGQADAVGAFVAMLSLLWTSQLDRHGTDDDSVPMTVTIEQAQDAVLLAALVVQWIHSYAFTRVAS